MLEVGSIALIIAVHQPTVLCSKEDSHIELNTGSGLICRCRQINMGCWHWAYCLCESDAMGLHTHC